MRLMTSDTRASEKLLTVTDASTPPARFSSYDLPTFGASEKLYSGSRIAIRMTSLLSDAICYASTLLK